MALPRRIEIVLDPSFSAFLVANEILESVCRAYGDAVDIRGMQAAMDEIWKDLHQLLSEEECLRIGDVNHVSVPLGDLNARICSPPSGIGHYVLFDALLDFRMTEIFTAPRNVAAWATCYVRAILNHDFGLPWWVAPAAERLKKVPQEKDNGIPDSYSYTCARDFVFAHECGHFFLGHLGNGSRKSLHFGNQSIDMYDPALRDETDADAFARGLLCRKEGRPLPVQQMGVDWLLGFLGAVLAMRSRAASWWMDHDDETPAFDPGVAVRRQLAWDDYNQRRAASPDSNDRAPENIANIERLRASVDAFNRSFAAPLADACVFFPDEIMAWQARVVEAPMNDDEVKSYLQELGRLFEKTDQRVRERRRSAGWLSRLVRIMKNAF